MPESKNLVIVESPAKQKTIGKILGAKFIVRSSMGHIRDLPQKTLGVDEKNNFAPSYEVSSRAKKTVAELKKSAKECDILYLATDHDREGEAIAWHLSELIGKPEDKVKRITFHEITADAVLSSLKNARTIDLNLVDAQQARRILDRLVGYKLSPVLWEKVSKGLSAGRVQSVAVRLLVERAFEIDNFKSDNFFAVSVKLRKENCPPDFTGRLVKWQGQSFEKTTTHKLFAEDYKVKTTAFSSVQSAQEADALIKKGPLTVINWEEKDVSQNPKPPFITSTLQQAAYHQLGFSAQKTMQTAQGLYEGVALKGGETTGLITYMRTDSFNVSKEIQAEALKFIEKEYGKNYLPKKPRFYASKVKGAQEAHEAIHPTSVFRKPGDIKSFLTNDQFKLYELIWRKFTASQMESAVFKSVAADIACGDEKNPLAALRCGGRTEKFEGYLKVYKDDAADGDTPEDDKAIIPELKIGDKLTALEVELKESKTSPPPFYNEASLVRTLEKHGIGRPSTYAPIIRTIIDRKYVARPPKTGRLVPTELGVIVTQKLKEFFREIMELAYTAGIEEQLDLIAEGQEKWTEVIAKFYEPFIKDIKEARAKMSSENGKESGEKCPICASPMLIRHSRFGKYLSCSKYPKCEGKIKLDSAGKKVELVKTDIKCDKCQSPMVIRTGRRGKFMACSAFPKCRNTYSIDENGNKVAGSASAPVETDIKCDKCKKPMLLRDGKRGPFLGCSGFPRCRNIKSVSQEEADKIKGKSN